MARAQTKQGKSARPSDDGSDVDVLPAPNALKNARRLARNMGGATAWDLLMWVTIADQYLTQPASAMARLSRDPRSLYDVVKAIEAMERRSGRILVERIKQRGLSPSKRRGRLLTWHGVLLADIAAVMEHLWMFFLASGSGERAVQEFRSVKDVAFRLLPEPSMRRQIDRNRYVKDMGGHARPDRIALHLKNTRQHCDALKERF